MRSILFRKALLPYGLLALIFVPVELAAQPQPGASHGPDLRFGDVHSRSACLAMLPRLRRLCTPGSFSGENYVQILIGDFDSDGGDDVAIRYLERHRCSGGSHGCQTEVYLITRRGFVNVLRNVVTVGHVQRCRRSARPGIRFGAPIEVGHCFFIDSASTRNDFGGLRQGVVHV